jgi:hypothetical protein
MRTRLPHFASKIAEAPLRQRTAHLHRLRAGTCRGDGPEGNRFQGLRKVIDISGDGPNNQGGAVTLYRDRAVAAGITINGLPLMLKSNENGLAGNAEHRSLL